MKNTAEISNLITSASNPHFWSGNTLKIKNLLRNNSYVREECKKNLPVYKKLNYPQRFEPCSFLSRDRMPFNFMWLQKNHQQHSQQKWIKFTYIFLHHIRAMFSHHLHVILYEHSILLLSTFQHGVDSNVRTSSTNTSTVMKKTNKRSQKKNDHVVKRKKNSADQQFWIPLRPRRGECCLHYTCSTHFLSHWGKSRFFAS